MFVFADELSGLVSNQRKASFTCQPCRDNQNQHSSLKEELQRKLAAGLEEVLADLLADTSAQHLLICKTVRFITQSLKQSLNFHVPPAVVSSHKCLCILFTVLWFSVRKQTACTTGNGNQSVTSRP